MALGGNALLPRGQRPDANVERATVDSAARTLSKVATEHEVVLTFGNGPQVGVMASLYGEGGGPSPYPLDVIGAQTQGMLAYWLVQSLKNEQPQREIVAVINQVIVDSADPAFDEPTKFVGRTYSLEEAGRLSAERGWQVKRDGSQWRRVVPSPHPRAVVEIEALRALVERGFMVVCGGGGGVPVVMTAAGHLHGVEAVVDKDLTSVVLAEELEAELLVILTDVPHVYRDWNGARSAPIHRATPAEMLALPFPRGSMGPKIQAASSFVSRTGHAAVIGNVENLAEALDGHAGTWIVPAPEEYSC